MPLAVAEAAKSLNVAVANNMNILHSSAPKIMGILNITPDSFSDGGRYKHIDQALAQAERMLSEGADILDIGGESTRPGSDPVSAEEQINRVCPVIARLRKQHPNLDISIDTMSSLVAEAAIQAGANIINDVSGGDNDPQILAVCARHDVAIILMHMQGTPKTMQDNPHYDEVVAEVKNALLQTETALLAGVEPEKIAIDPGIGFGKRRQDNLELLANLQELVATGYPVLLGTSRKRFMGAICNITEPHELVTATAVTTALGVMAGVKLFRVHDVLANRQAADIAWAIKQASQT